MPKGSIKVKRIMRRYGKKDELKKIFRKTITSGYTENTTTTGGFRFEYTYLSSGIPENLSEKGTHSE